MTNRLMLDALALHRYPLCGVGYKRTREHLLSWRAVLPPAVKAATVSVSRQEQEAPLSPHSGTWLFLYENIPQLRYHNPNVKFSFEAHHDTDSMLLLTSDGEPEEARSIVTTGLRQKEIRKLVQDFIDKAKS